MAKKNDKTNKGLKKIDLGRQTPIPRDKTNVAKPKKKE
jgi:hypothetical protein